MVAPLPGLCYQAGRQRGARAFQELRRYHTRPLQLGPQKCSFWKKGIFGTQISMLGFFGKFKKLPGATFFIF